MRSIFTRRGALQRLGFIALTVVLGLVTTTMPSIASELDDARSAGEIGERPDGLVGAVNTNAVANIVSLVRNVNRARMDSYRALAEKEGTNVGAVQAVAGERQIEKAVQNGWYVMDAGGSWRKR
jgi:uncharacterized protein